MPLSTIEAYKKHTMALSNALHPPQIPRLCQLVSTARQQAKQLSVPGLLKMPSQPAISTFKALEDVQGYTTDIKNRPIPLSTAGQAHLESQKQAQETLTDELVGLAAAMKSNTLALETKVQERGRLLDGTEAALNESSLATKTAVEKAKAIHRRGRLNFCLSCLVIFLICGGFAGMFIFIRITSFVGYKNYKGTSSASQPLIPHQTPPTPLSHEEL